MPRDAPGDEGDLAGVRRLAHRSSAAAAASDAGSETAADDRFGLDALDHAGEHLPGPHSKMWRDAAGAQRLDRLDPADRAERLAIERIADRRRLGLAP